MILHLFYRLRPLMIALIFCCIPNQSNGAQIFKIASLAPAGSVWVDQFAKFAQEVKQKSGGEILFKVYPGGVMGNDKAMLRKMRVGQLHGGGFTMTGISELIPDFRVMAIPFLFHSYQEVDHVKEGLLPSFKDTFRDHGMELIAMTEVGFIYAMSTKPIATFADLQQSKNWSPIGDPISETYLKALGITPVQLTIPDVLSSLQSGLIDTVYNSLYGSIILQWFTKANHIVNIPYGYAYGVFSLDRRKFSKLTPQQQQIITAAANQHFSTLLKDTRKSNMESRQVLIDQGAKFLDVDEATIKHLQDTRDQTIYKLIPGSFSQKIYDMTTTLLNEYRSHSEATKTTP